MDSDALLLLSLIVTAVQLEAHEHIARHNLLRQVSALLKGEPAQLFLPCGHGCW